MNITLQRSLLDFLEIQAKNNEYIISIPSEFLIPSQKDKIIYTLVSLFMYYCDLLVYGKYDSDAFDSNTGIWWQCYDDEISEISDLSEGVITRKSF